jgi:hypothetical protein
LVNQDNIAYWLLDSIPQDGLPVFHTGLDYLARNSTHSGADIRHDVAGWLTDFEERVWVQPEAVIKPRAHATSFAIFCGCKRFHLGIGEVLGRLSIVLDHNVPLDT